jgi:hypothetical protein
MIKSRVEKNDLNLNLRKIHHALLCVDFWDNKKKFDSQLNYSYIKQEWRICM